MRLQFLLVKRMMDYTIFYDGMGDGEMIAFSENYLKNNSDKHQIFEGGSEERTKELVAEIMKADIQ